MHIVDPRIASQRLESLRRYRTPQAAVDIAADVQRLIGALQSRRKAVGGLDAAWRAEVPTELQERVAMVGLSRGTMTCRCNDASARFQFDRWARSGGLTRLAAVAGVGVARCKWTS